MKEIYFTRENVNKKAEEFLLDLHNKNKLSFLPEKSALLVIDMQEFFLNGTSHAYIPSSKAITPNISALVKKYLGNNLTVIATKHINTPENAGMMETWWKDILSKDGKFSKIIPEFQGLKTIEKTQYDAFYDTNLEELLKNKGIEQLVITGVMTHLCCETTARSAFVRGFHPYFTIDGTATYNEEFHRASLLNLSHGFTVPVLCSHILEKLG